MSNGKLQKFLKLHLKAKVLVYVKDEVCDLISFNRFLNLSRYKAYLKSKERDVCFNHFNVPCSVNSTMDYREIIKSQFIEGLTEFIQKSGFLIHKQISIEDKFGKQYDFDDLSEDVKQKISTFISLQKISLQNFLLKFSQSGNMLPSPNAKWEGKDIELIELLNVLFIGGYILGENGPQSKKEYMQMMMSFFGRDPGNWEITLNKAMSRENPAKFIDKLKATILKHNED